CGGDQWLRFDPLRPLGLLGGDDESEKRAAVVGVLANGAATGLEREIPLDRFLAEANRAGELLDGDDDGAIDVRAIDARVVDAPQISFVIVDCKAVVGAAQRRRRPPAVGKSRGASGRLQLTVAENCKD